MRLPLLFPALVHGLRSTHNPTCRFFRKRSAYTICEPEMVLTPKLGLPWSRRSNPRTPNAASTLKNLRFGEPDASLFRVPEGYRIVDGPAVAAQ
jgi:hypothetical protein